MRFLVTGASGNVGSELVRQLAAAGHQVSAVTRDPAKANLPAGVDAVRGDLNDAASLRPAWSGVTGLFLMSGYPATPELLADAAAAGVSRMVLLSGGSAGDPESTNAITRYQTVTETQVRDSGLPATVLRPSGFMSNAMEWVAQLRSGDVIEGPFGNVRVAVIDPYDIAGVAATALVADDDRHVGRVYRLSGPEAMRPADRVAVLADVLSRPLRFRAQSDDEAYQSMSKQLPVEYVDAFFDFYVRGTLDESPVYDTVAEVTGRPPHTFREWAVAHADAFR
ncbi:MAG TPA: NAD(P)H-binding protein [Pseudonocardiaceae bacterium]|jgi:uncharacterized protein YbjT (DUF2867 family)|nr:NAD(P)H-binding protein [Pseudonocardiaceae bacterium]